MTSITVQELKKRISEKEDLVLIDVREPWEHADFNIGGLLIPLDDILTKVEMISKEKPVVFYCRKGVRSLFAIQKLQQKFNFSNLINLTGGMEAWQRELTP
jgi:rhodanese-related sulfurtransferase